MIEKMSDQHAPGMARTLVSSHRVGHSITADGLRQGWGMVCSYWRPFVASTSVEVAVPHRDASCPNAGRVNVGGSQSGQSIL